MSFTSLTSHVILLMLVSWMGAELLASGNRMIRRVFGKLSVLLGMYAFDMPADRRIQPDPWAYPVHRSAGQRNHVVRGDTVFDPIYWRTWEETLTVDYSTWLASLPKFFYRQKARSCSFWSHRCWFCAFYSTSARTLPF